ncbi:hypothetical protein PVAP13_9NG338200 [Panicum virgatum]|uniref:Uncharacterized protein n=1 Tax=Panicum virgatum TaxID=38727 RepID=A0A8T0MP25_PANVG|nr:hypothetical protein PVAP13_9NG338200 [Panicum virgatum]
MHCIVSSRGRSADRWAWQLNTDNESRTTSSLSMPSKVALNGAAAGLDGKPTGKRGAERDAERRRLDKDAKRGGRNHEPVVKGQRIASRLD